MGQKNDFKSSSFTSLSSALSYAASLRDQGYSVSMNEVSNWEATVWVVTGSKWIDVPDPDPTPTPTPTNYSPNIKTNVSNFGGVSQDFEFNYTVTDDNDSRVRVQIEIDGSVKQAYTYVNTGRQQNFLVKIKEYSAGEHTIYIRAKDSRGKTSSRTIKFTRQKLAPVVSAYDTQLGSKFENFDISYTVTDEDSDSVNVSVAINGAIVQAPEKTTLGIRKAYTVDISSVKLGDNIITVTATDDEGQTTSLDYYFAKVNTAPTISGEDENLGAKNVPFTYRYSVDDREGDNLSIIERVNGEIVRNISNAKKNFDYSINVTKEQIQSLDIDDIGTIEVEVEDAKGSTTYRRVVFSKDNFAPVISGSDRDYGELKTEFTYTYQVSDPEEDAVSVEVFLDGKIIQSKEVTEPNVDKTIEIKSFDFLKVPYGTHTVKIQATDEIGNTSLRLLTFERTAEKLIMELANNGIETDAMAKKILVSTAGVYLAKGAELKVEVCNNSLDDEPTWEDATSVTNANKAFNFQNETKLNDKAGINIRFTIDKGTSTVYSYITAIGGSYE